MCGSDFRVDMILLIHDTEERLRVEDQLACMEKIQLSTIIVDFCSAW